MSRKTVRAAWAVFSIVIAAPVLAAEDAADENYPYSTVTTPEGLTFRVPEDMPIEKRGGIVAPIPFDEYTYGKFKKIEKRLEAMDGRLERIEKALATLAAAAEKRPLQS